MDNIPDPLRDSFAFHLAESEVVRRPTSPQRLTFDHVYPRNFHSITAPFARAIVPLELVQAGDKQAVVHSRVGVHPMQPVSIDFLVNYPTVTSIVADQIVQARRPLCHIQELFVLTHLGTVDQETLANLPGLESLSLGPGFGTQAVALEDVETYDWDADRLDLTVLEGMTCLQNLRFNALAVQSLEPLQHLPQLVRLRIEGTPRPSDARSLAGQTRLRWLGLEYMKGLQHLKSLTNLEHVELNEPSLSNLKAFKEWKKVQSLVLTGRGVKSLEGIQSLTALEELFLGRTNVSDLVPLAHATNLRRLRLAFPDRITDFSQIRSLLNLRELIITMGNITSTGHLATIDFITGLDLLEKIEIIGAVIDDQNLEPILGLPNLQLVRLLGDYGSQEYRIRRQNPKCEVDIIPLVPEPRQIIIRVGPLVIRKIEDGFWSIFQDFSDLLGVENNYIASERVRQVLYKRNPELLGRLDFNPDADFVSIQAISEEDIRSVAAAINDFLSNRNS